MIIEGETLEETRSGFDFMQFRTDIIPYDN